MELIIEQEGKGQIQIFQEIPQDLKHFVVGHATPNAVQGENFKALWQEFKGDGFSAWYNRYWTTVPVVLKAKGPGAVLELRIALNSIIRGTWDKIGVSALPKYHFQMGFVPHVLTRAIFDTAPEYETFDIHFHLWWLETLGFDYKELDRFINKIHTDKVAELTEFPHHCTPRMFDYVYDILNTQYSDYGKKHVLKEAVKGILFEAMEAVYVSTRDLPPLRPEQIEQLHHIKALIEAECPQYRGNDKLMEAVGINEYLFHVGFKQLFGDTPKDYYLKKRLMEAKQLLRQGMSVNQVAHKLDYVSASPFIEIFKAKFRYTPKEFQRRKL